MGLDGVGQVELHLAEQYLQLILVILIDKLEELHYHLFGALN
jgi:hypothetical protein